MAKVTTLVDDIDGTPAEESILFSYRGRDYEIDLNKENIERLDAVLAEWIEKATRISRAGRPGPRPGTSDPRTKKIRKWAKENGLDVPSRGRLKAEIIEAYDAAH